MVFNPPPDHARPPYPYAKGSEMKALPILEEHNPGQPLGYVMMWRPISTAPQEIEFRCLVAHEVSAVTAYWNGHGWINERSHENNYFPATHWMPLPPLP